MKNLRFKNPRRNFLFLLILISTMLVTPALTTGISTEKQVVILQLEQDEAVRIATLNVLDENPDAIVIEYGTWKASIILASKINNLIVIGHGNDNGVSTSQGRLSWEAYSKFLERLNSQTTILLNCDSDRIKPHSDNHDLITFNGNVDATMGSLFASVIINIKQGGDKVSSLIGKMIQTSLELERGTTQYVPLGLVSVEKAWIIVNLIMVLLALMSTEAIMASSITLSLVQSMIYSYAIFNAPVILGIILWSQGEMTDSDFASSLLGFLIMLDDFDFFGNLLSALWEISYTEWLILGASFLLTVVAYAATSSTTFWIRLAGYLLILGYIGLEAYWDYQDCDNMVGQDPNAPACGSTPPSGGGTGKWL